MFTGLIEYVGSVRRIVRSSGGAICELDLGPLASDAQDGDSICINGVCLTISKLNDTHASFDIVRETLSRSTLGSMKTGDPVNLERAMPADGRFGGHFVQGHVDGIATVARIVKVDKASEWTFAMDTSILSGIIEKGSIAIDGVSLTVASLQPTGFSVALIPTTIEKTTIRHRKVGDTVNIELDMIGKYVLRAVRQIALPANGGANADIEFLKRLGWND